jgi:hypothetical protein
VCVVSSLLSCTLFHFVWFLLLLLFWLLVVPALFQFVYAARTGVACMHTAGHGSESKTEDEERLAALQAKLVAMPR